jgi:hypothetical protein
VGFVLLGGELRCSGSVGSSCSTSDTRRVNLVTLPVVSHERGRDREVLTTNGIYPKTLPGIALLFVLFLLVIALFVRFTESDYPFDIFKLFLGRSYDYSV